MGIQKVLTWLAANVAPISSFFGVTRDSLPWCIRWCNIYIDVRVTRAAEGIAFFFDSEAAVDRPGCVVLRASLNLLVSPVASSVDSGVLVSGGGMSKQFLVIFCFRFKRVSREHLQGKLTSWLNEFWTSCIFHLITTQCTQQHTGHINILTNFNFLTITWCSVFTSYCKYICIALCTWQHRCTLWAPWGWS